MIKRKGDKWNVYTEDGSRLLGSHPSKEKAMAQLRAIEASKHGTSKPKKKRYLGQT